MASHQTWLLVIRLGILTESGICLGSESHCRFWKWVLLLLAPSKYIPLTFPLSWFSLWLLQAKLWLGKWINSKPMLLLLSRFSRVRLCATPETAAHQALPSLGFSRQEHWSGLLFPSPMQESESEVTQWCLILSDPMDCSPPGSSIHGIFQAKVLEWVPLPFLKPILATHFSFPLPKLAITSCFKDLYKPLEKCLVCNKHLQGCKTKYLCTFFWRKKNPVARLLLCDDYKVIWKQNMPHRMPVHPALPWPASIQLFCDSVSHPVTLLVASEWAGFGFVIPQHCRAEQLGLLGSQGGGCGSLYPFPLHSWSPGPARSAQQTNGWTGCPIWSWHLGK